MERYSLNRKAKCFANRNKNLDFVVSSTIDSCLKRMNTILSVALINVENVFGEFMLTRHL